MRKIIPFLWFDGQAEEVARFYVSIFKNSSIIHITPGPGGIAQWVSFKLEGEEFMVLNGGPEFKFTEAISFFVMCNGQKEVDYL